MATIGEIRVDQALDMSVKVTLTRGFRWRIAVFAFLLKLIAPIAPFGVIVEVQER